MFTGKKRVISAAAAVALAGGAIIATAPAASADIERSKRGDCSKSSTWKLDVEKEQGRLEVDFEGRTSKSGKNWKVKVVQNGDVKYNGTRTTERDGEFEVDRNLNNKKGKDKIVVHAKQKASGETCKASLKI